MTSKSDTKRATDVDMPIIKEQEFTRTIYARTKSTQLPLKTIEVIIVTKIIITI